MKLKDFTSEGAMPSNVIKHKERLRMMTDKEFGEYVEKAAKERGRSTEEHAKRLEQLHALPPGKYTNRLKK